MSRHTFEAEGMGSQGNTLEVDTGRNTVNMEEDKDREMCRVVALLMEFFDVVVLQNMG